MGTATTIAIGIRRPSAAGRCSSGLPGSIGCPVLPGTGGAKAAIFARAGRLISKADDSAQQKRELVKAANAGDAVAMNNLARLLQDRVAGQAGSRNGVIGTKQW